MPDSSPPDSSPPDPEPGPEPDVVDAKIVTPAAPAVPEAPPPVLPAPDYDERGTPSFDYVRDKIEGRFSTSVGTGELAAETPQGRSLAEQEEERAQKAKDKLAEIRRSLGGG